MFGGVRAELGGRKWCRFVETRGRRGFIAVAGEWGG